MKKVKKIKLSMSIISLILVITSIILFFSLSYSQIHILIIFISLTITSLISLLILYRIEAKQKETVLLQDDIIEQAETKQQALYEEKQEETEQVKISQVRAKSEIIHTKKIEEPTDIVKSESNLKNEVLNRYNQITMNEYVESTSAKKLYNDKKKQTLWILFLPLIPLVAFFVFFNIKVGSDEINFLMGSCAIIFLILTIGLLIICPIIRNAYLSKYRIIYLTAKKNDEVRYNEKIRFMERKRLEEQYNNENNDENILRTINGIGETIDD